MNLNSNEQAAVLFLHKKDEVNRYEGVDETILDTFFSNTTDLIWIVDEDSHLIKANQSFFEFFRLNKDDLGMKISEILPLGVADALYDKHLKVLQTGIAHQSIENGKLLDGTQITFQVNLFLCPTKEGKRLIGGIAKDQLEKQSIVRKLNAATERLINLSRVTTDAIWEWDMLTGEIIRNEKLTDLTGYLPETQKGLAWWLSRVHPDDRNMLSDTLAEVTDKGQQSWESEYRFFCADGEYKNILDRGFVIYDKGMPMKMIGALSDVTSQKLLENLLLEEKVRQFKILSESAIRVQEQERSRLGREMHDNVNQILTTIKLYLGMLTPSSAAEGDIKKKSIEYTLMAIEEIRKLSKEMVAPQLDGGSLSDHIGNLIADIEEVTPIRIRFTHDNENDLLSPGKKLALFRIAQEQLKNVLKYSKAKNLEILLHSKNGMVHLSIIDNGVGFNMKKSGSGIGLANIRERVKFYGGKMEIISAINEGCQLNVTIPVAD